MWSGFEWENKVTVHTNIGDLRDYLHHLVSVSVFLSCFRLFIEIFFKINFSRPI